MSRANRFLQNKWKIKCHLQIMFYRVIQSKLKSTQRKSRKDKIPRVTPFCISLQSIWMKTCHPMHRNNTDNGHNDLVEQFEDVHDIIGKIKAIALLGNGPRAW